MGAVLGGPARRPARNVGAVPEPSGGPFGRIPEAVGAGKRNAVRGTKGTVQATRSKSRMLSIGPR